MEATGRVEIELDDQPVLRGEGADVRTGVVIGLAEGPHPLRVRFEHAGPGPRLRLGWTRPASDGSPGTWSEVVPARWLGPSSSALPWRLTDLLALGAALLAGALAWAIPWDAPRSLPTPTPMGRRETWVSLVGYAVLAALMSWPLVLDLAASGVVDRPDGRLNVWILAWDAWALAHAPGRLFQAPIFHPLPDTLAFSENLLLPAVVQAPLALAGWPLLGYNLVLLSSLVLSAVAAQALVRRVTGGALAGFMGGALFGFGSHRWFRLAHLHAELTLFLPLTLLALDRYWERRTLGRALLVGLCLALQGSCSVYLGAITATSLVVSMAVMVAGGLHWRGLLRLGAGLGLASLLLFPLARPYWRMRGFEGMEFGLAEQARAATSLGSYLASDANLWGPVTALHLDARLARDPLFPGLVPLVLGVAGLAVAPRRYRSVGLAISVTAVVLSLGPATPIHRWLFEHVTWFRGIRALGRFSLVPMLALSVWSALAVAGRRPAVAAIGLVFGMLEASHAPIRYGHWSGPSLAARWLAGRPGAVAYLPLGTEGDTWAMLDGVAHWRPLLNGDSGFIPRAYDRAMELLNVGSSSDAPRFLRAVGVTEVVAGDDRSWPLRARFGGQRVYAVPAGDVAHEPPSGRSVPTLWSSAGALVDFGRPVRLSALIFELSDDPWLATPEVGVSDDGSTWRAVGGRASLADATLSLYRDPRHGIGAVVMPPTSARYVRVGPGLPARRTSLAIVEPP